MPKKRSRRRPSERLLPVSAAERKLDTILPLFDEGEAERALELLCAMRGRYRLPGRYWAMRARAHDVKRERTGFLAELVDAAPGYESDSVFLFTIGTEYARVGRIFAAHVAAERAKEAAGDSELLSIAAGFADDLSEELADAGRWYRFRIPDELALAVRFDQALVFIEEERFTEGIDILRALVPNLRDNASVRHVLAHVLWLIGRYEAAVEAVGPADSADFIPIASDGARFHALLGNDETAAAFAERLTVVEPETGADLYATCVGLAYAGADRALVELLDRPPALRDLLDRDDRDELLRFEATARARLGDKERARELWQRLADRDGLAADAAKRNLKNLDLPPDERRTPWYFGYLDLVPDEILRMIADSESDDEHALREAILTDHPEIERIEPFLMWHSDAAAREFALWLVVGRAAGYETDGTIEIDGYIVTYDAVNAYPQDIAETAERGHDLMNDDRPEEAIACFEEALAAHDENPTLHQNLAAAYERAGRSDEAQAKTRSLHERFPDYFFARAAMAVLAARDGGVAEARRLARPLLEQTSQHVTEFTVLCDLMCRIAAEDHNAAELETWVSRWEAVDEDDSRIAGWRSMANLLTGLERFAQSSQKRWKRTKDQA
jgi:tetratricopeptide (TPR) repeat protein